MMRVYLPGGLLKRPAADFSDLTAAVRTGAVFWDPDEVDVLVVPFDTDPTPTEQEAIRRRLVTATPAEEDRYGDLIAMRETATSPFEVMWLDTELAKYEPMTGV